MPGTLVVFADDTPSDSLRWMPRTRRFARRGCTFTRAYSNSPVCRPARASISVGRTAERTRIFSVTGSGEVVNAIDGGTWSHHGWGEWVAATGALTLFVGKYHSNTLVCPPGSGWTRQRSMDSPTSARGYTVWDENGDSTTPNLWHTTYAAGEVIDLIDAAEADDLPWFVWWCPGSPHSPFDPSPGRPLQYADVTGVLPAQTGTDWPSWITSRAPISAPASLNDVRASQATELWDIDQHLGQVLDHLDSLDVLDESTVIFTGDNGMHLGDHRYLGPATKNTCYEPAARVPFVAVGPGFPTSRTIDVPVSLVDVTATVLAIHGADAEGTWTPPTPQEGTDLRDVAADPATHADRAVLLQVRDGSETPYADAVVTATDKLIHYSDGGDITPVPDGEEWEGYRLDSDPGELVNVADDPSWAATRTALEAELTALLDP